MDITSSVGSMHGRLVHGRRVRVLSRHLVEMIAPGATVLDVGCGDGVVDSLVVEQRPDVTISGIDILLRPAARIPVAMFDGITIPHRDKSFDIVMFLDVLHHTHDPTILLKEARRVARKFILIKDHSADGFFAEPTLKLMDWVGNAPHRVVLTYNYWPEARWRETFHQLDTRLGEYRTRLGLYPVPMSWIFERSLHFFARLDLTG